jgi:uncharacterized protein (DUF58 family)
MRIKPASLIIPALICLLALATGSILLWRIFYVLVSLLVVGLIWSLININDIVILPGKLAEKVTTGDWIEEEIIVNNKVHLPKFMITIWDKFNFPGQTRQLSLNLAPDDWYRWNSGFRFSRRGKYNLGLFRISTSDPFGFITLYRTSGEPQSIIVYPQVIELPFFQPELYYNPESGAGRWMPNETGTSVSRVREYSRGDTLNHIHWQSTAHTGNLMVKVFDPEQSRFFGGDIWLVLNMHRDIYPENNNIVAEDSAVTIAASLIHKYSKSGKRIGFLTAGDTRCFFPPDTGDNYRNKIMELLALIKASGSVPLNDLVSQEIGHINPDSIIVIITTSTDDKLAAAVRELKNRRYEVIVIMLDSSSFNGTEAGVTTARYPLAEGTPVYHVKNGQDLSKILDSRKPLSSVNYTQGKN